MPFTPAIEAMFTIAPPPLRSMAGTWNFIPRNVPRTLVAMPRSNSAGSISASGAGSGPSVALLNAASSLPNSRSAASARFSAELGVGDVGRHRDRPAAVRLDPLDHGCQRPGVPGTQHHGGSGRRERLGRGRADPPAGAGDQRHLAAHWLSRA